MEFSVNKYGFNIQFIPVYGLGLGFLYYNPNLEPSSPKVSDEDFYEQITILILIGGIHITWWRL